MFSLISRLSLVLRVKEMEIKLLSFFSCIINIIQGFFLKVIEYKNKKLILLKLGPQKAINGNNLEIFIGREFSGFKCESIIGKGGHTPLF